MQNTDYLRKDLTQGDKDRIYRMKLASDAVQGYYTRMSEDHRNIDAQNHEDRVRALMEVVSTTLEYGESQQIRVGFFIANVFETILQGLQNQGLEKTSWLSKEVIKSLYKREDIILDFADEEATEIGYACGCFVPEHNPSAGALVTIEPARAGDVVGVDNEFFEVIPPEESFETCQEELQEHFPNVSESDPQTKAQAFLYILQLFAAEFDIEQLAQVDDL